MIKKYQRVHMRWMRRSSRIYLNDVNCGKVNVLREFLTQYQNGLNYTIVRLWSDKDFDNKLLGKSVTGDIAERFGVTARLSQCIGKQAKETVISQRKRFIKRMPRVHNRTANLDSRFVTIEKFNGNEFDMCLKFASGVPNVCVPFNLTKHTNKFLNNDWVLCKSIRLGYDSRRLFVDLMFEKERPIIKTDGKLIGIDRGYNCMLMCSDKQEIGREIKEKIKSGGKRRKSYQHYITTEENRCLKHLDLTGVKEIVLENLKNVKMNKRGTFSRNVNRLLSFWHYAKVGRRLEQLCEEFGVRINLKNPAYTSQRCSVCGNIDRRNRNGEKFLCRKCNHRENADYNASKNLEQLGLAEVYSLRSLQKQVGGNYNS